MQYQQQQQPQEESFQYETSVIQQNYHFHHHNQISSVTTVNTIHQQQQPISYGSSMSGNSQGKLNQQQQQQQQPTSNDITSSLWGPPRMVILNREPNKSLGISIVGGKLDVCSSSNSTSSGSGRSSGGVGHQVSSFISGIFIKHVLDNSPAGLNGTLKTGDRILAVNDIDLTQATHDRAVEVIRNARTPVKFLIQSLIYINTYTPTCDEDVLGGGAQQPATPAHTASTSHNASSAQLPSVVTTTTTTSHGVDENVDPNSIDKNKQVTFLFLKLKIITLS